MYKNEYTMNKKFITEYVLGILCKKIFIFGILLIIMAIITFVLNGTKSYLEVEACFLIVLFMTFGPMIMIKNFVDNSERLNNGKIEKTIVNFDNNIVMDEGRAHLEFEYNQIKKIKETKNFIVLMLSNSSAILVFKDGFVNGNKEEFLEFIKNKIK
jgi:hypothetical protein